MTKSIKAGEPMCEDKWEFNDYGEPMDTEEMYQEDRHEEMFTRFLTAKSVPKKSGRKRWSPSSHAENGGSKTR